MKWSARFLVLITVFFIRCSSDEHGPQEFTPIDLDAFSQNFKGFNLLGKFDVNWSNAGFSEQDFSMVHDLGFNFVRLPLDYLTYTDPNNWNNFVESEVMEIDKAVEWGKQYGIHVCLCLHRAPGYSVNTSEIPSSQKLDLWTNQSAQDAFVNHWGFFADRYKDVSYKDLSFNLINEPPDMDEATYAKVMKKAIDKIQSINPNRVIYVDGLSYARNLVTSLKGIPDVIQAIHCYDPMTLTHYKASWVAGSDSWPLPTWPMLDISQYLFGPYKPEYQSSLVLNGVFRKGMKVIINVQQVSVSSTLEIKLDGGIVYSKPFICGPDLGSDWTQIVSTQWGYQNISSKDYTTTLPADGSKITISNTQGDWMTFNRITLRSDTADLVIVPANTTWGARQDEYTITAQGKLTDKNGQPLVMFGGLQSTIEEAKSEGIPLMVQEFGVHNQTPHDVTLAFLTDLVTVFRNNNLGYALWNFNGSFGILDSDRSDCSYESYQGHLLDRQMLDILK